MHLCIFNPEHDLCLAKGRANYVPPRSAVEFAMRDAAIMQALYPEAHCCSAYDAAALRALLPQAERITAWGWNAVVKRELLKHGAPESLLPTDEQLAAIRQLQHRSTVLPLQAGAREVRSEAEVRNMQSAVGEHVVLKAPWSGAGRGIRWVHGALTEIDRSWLAKMVRQQGCALAEPRREVAADVAIEYVLSGGKAHFVGYSLFCTGSGVYKENIMASDDEIARRVSLLTRPRGQLLEETRHALTHWLEGEVASLYNGPLGIDLMVGADGGIYVAEMNLRHTMGMVAHTKINRV